MSIEYNKLVRDKIPKIIEKAGKVPITHVADDEKYWKMLKAKLLEEAREFQDNEEPEEIADLLEIILALAEYKGLTPGELEKIRKEKAVKRGAFEEKRLNGTNVW